MMATQRARVQARSGSKECPHLLPKVEMEFSFTFKSSLRTGSFLLRKEPDTPIYMLHCYIWPNTMNN